MEGYKLVSEVPVRFSDTDGLGHVNNANYLSYLEVSRIDYLRKVVGRVNTCASSTGFGISAAIAAGMLATRRVLSTPPSVSLRELQE